MANNPQAPKRNVPNDPRDQKYDFNDLIIDFPKPGDLGILWSERMKLDLAAPYFGWGPITWDILDLRLTMRGDLIALMQSIAEEYAAGMRLVFFLPREFDIGKHILEIKSSDDDAKVMTSWRKPPYDQVSPPPVDILLLKDFPTLAAMSARSPYLCLLEYIAADQPEGEGRVYFLALPEVILANDWGLKLK